jgi:hypothetical protein
MLILFTEEPRLCIGHSLCFYLSENVSVDGQCALHQETATDFLNPEHQNTVTVQLY